MSPRKALQVSKGGISGSFLSDSTPGSATDPGPYLQTYAHDAYVAGNGSDGQANASLKTFSNAMAGPFQAYHFFCDDGNGPPYLYTVVETASGTFKHTGIGQIEKMGAVNTGAFAYGCNWYYSTSPTTAPNISDPDHTRHTVPFDTLESSGGRESTFVRGDSDGIAPRWYRSYSTQDNVRMTGGVRGTEPFSNSAQSLAFNYALMKTGASARTGRTFLQECLVGGFRSGVLYSLLGFPPGIRWVNMRYLDPGDVIVLGTESWKIFPVIRKNGTVGQPNSGVFGYAFKVS